MILWLASYPRSGNSFLRVVLKEAFGVGSYSVYEEPAGLAAQGLDLRRPLESMAISEDLCPVKTHELPGDDSHPAIYLVRDARDALVSYAHFVLDPEPPADVATCADPFTEMLRRYVATDDYFGGWGRHVSAWTTRRGRTAVVRFEDLIANPIREISTALETLGIALAPIGRDAPSFAELHRLDPKVFRRGEVGSYAGETPRQLEDLLWARFGGVMRRFGYPSRKLQIDGPLVTVVTPSYNQGTFIRDAIESVLSQDYPHVEHIVVDGGSTDETASIVAEYGGRLTWICEPDRGQSDAINKGFRKAKGEIVCWVNCDDLLLPRALSLAVEAFRARPSAGAVYGDGYLLDAAGCVQRDFPKPGGMNVWKLVHVSDFLLQPSTFFRKSVLDEVGHLDESLRWAMDWELFMRIAKRHPMAYVPAALSAQREYEGTKIASGGRKRFRELVAVMRRHGRHRYPPAYFAYGAETYRTIALGTIDGWQRWLGAANADRLRALVERVEAWIILSAFKPGEGWYADHWATTRARIQLYAEGSALRLRGEVPGQYPKLEGQTLEVILDGRRLFERRLDFGTFECIVPVAAAERVVDLELRASRSFVPKREGVNDDPRRLAYLLREVAWTTTTA